MVKCPAKSPGVEGLAVNHVKKTVDGKYSSLRDCICTDTELMSSKYEDESPLGRPPKDNHNDCTKLCTNESFKIHNHSVSIKEVTSDVKYLSNNNCPGTPN